MASSPTFIHLKEQNFGSYSICISYVGSSGLDGYQRFSPPSKIYASTMPRTYSGPVNFESSVSLDRPMRLSEIHVAAEHALKRTITDPDLLKSLSSLEEFEVSVIYIVR